MRFLFYITLFIGQVHGVMSQTLTFADIAPVSNVDSLEKWTVGHKSQRIERLQNLLILERTYTWVNANRQGRYFKEIEQLMAAFPSQSFALPSYHYLQAYFFYKKRQTYQASIQLKEALTQFERLEDASGILHCYSLYIIMQSSNFGDAATKSSLLQKEYIAHIEEILKEQYNLHDFVQAQIALLTLGYSDIVKKNSSMPSGRNGIKEGLYVAEGHRLEVMAEEAIALVQRDTKVRYSLDDFRTFLAITYYVQNRMLDSFKLNKEILHAISEQHSREKATAYLNLSNDCRSLEKIEEGKEYVLKGLAVLDKYEKENNVLRWGFYNNLQWFEAKKGNYKQALEFEYKMFEHYRKRIEEEKNDKMLDVQAQYEFERKQEQIKHLEEAEKRNFILLMVAILVVVGISILGYKLYSANQKIRRYFSARERFFGIIAHDLRRPMHAFHGIGDVISFHLKRKEYEVVESFSKSLDESGIAIQKMLDNMLNWVLSQRNELPYNPMSFPLSLAINAVVDLYQKVGIVKGISFEIDCSEDVLVYADYNAVELIVRNLVDNSYKALSERGKVRVLAKNTSPNRVEMQIIDNGRGISATKLEMIQKVFRRPERAVVGAEGMGMGMIMIGRFIQKNKGTIWVESSEMAGTTFTIVLPRRS